MKTKKNIYLASRLAVGGAEKFLVSLSNSLCNDPIQQIIVSLHNDNPLESEIDKRIHFISLHRRSRLDISPILKLRKLIRNEKPDTVFCLNFLSYFILRCALVGARQKSKTIISYHSTIPVNKKEYLLHKVYTSMLKKNDTIITVSSNQEKYTAIKYHIPASYFKTIHNGINTSHWKTPPSSWKRCEFRRKYGIPENAIIIVIAAGFRLEKNHIGAIHALKILHTKYNMPVYLLLVGSGPTEMSIKNLTAELKLEEYVKFAGQQADMRPFYWASDIFSLTSTSVETFSIAALEAMACGLPAVLTDIGGASEMISEPLNGYLCKPFQEDIAAAWEKACNTTYFKEKISEYIHTKFNLCQMVDQYRGLFNNHTL